MINPRTLFTCGGRRCLLPLLLLLFIARNASSQSNEEREHFQVKLGAFYDRGDFGSTTKTTSLYTPITFRYLGDRFDVGVTSAFAQVNTNGGVRLIDGVPTKTGEQPSLIREAKSGAGDTLVRGRVHLLDGTVTPFARVKIPTAPANLGLGTGKADYGFGVEVDKQFSPVLVFGDLGYTVTGKVAGLDLRNRVAGSFGLGGRISDSVVLSGSVDWRQSIVKGNENPTEVAGTISYRLSPTVTVSPTAYFGLNNSSPDFGGGIELSFKFGRY